MKIVVTIVTPKRRKRQKDKTSPVNRAQHGARRQRVRLALRARTHFQWGFNAAKCAAKVRLCLCVCNCVPGSQNTTSRHTFGHSRGPLFVPQILLWNRFGAQNFANWPQTGEESPFFGRKRCGKDERERERRGKGECEGGNPSPFFEPLSDLSSLYGQARRGQGQG